MTYLILLLHIPALFLTSLVQTTGYKMAIFTVIVSFVFVLFRFISFGVFFFFLLLFVCSWFLTTFKPRFVTKGQEVERKVPRVLL